MPKRETQVIQCCAKTYWRWRFPGKRFPGSQIAACSECGTHLYWPERYEPRDDRRVARLRQIRRRLRFRLSGLTATGKPRKRFPVTRQEKIQNRRNRYKRWYRNNLKMGLTGRGTARVRHMRINPVTLRYNQFRSELNIKLPEIEATTQRF